jgi:phage host-nuclease inhibitor protein Gam
MDSQEEKKQSGKQAPETQNLDRVRDILFGSNLTEFNRRFAAIEEFFQSEINRVSSESKRMNETLQALFQQETDALRERTTRNEERLVELRDTMDARIRDLDREMRAMSERLSREIFQLREQTQLQLRELAAEFDQRMVQIDQRLTRVKNELEASKAGRRELAALLTDLATQLAGGIDEATKA